jgi:hypothetical protein
MIRPYREELKFVVHQSVKTLLIERWRRYLVKAPFTNRYAVSPILSQYYDSPYLHFYHEKLAGVGLRNKVRLRVYDMQFRAGATAFLEVKHRQNHLVKKFRQGISDFKPLYLDPANWTFDHPEEETVFRTLLERFRLRRSAQRLTSRILRDRSRNLMADTVVILEVKATHGIPNWLREGVLSAELEQKTIPKYITAVEALRLVELNGGGVYA